MADMVNNNHNLLLNVDLRQKKIWEDITTYSNYFFISLIYFSLYCHQHSNIDIMIDNR